MSNWYDNFIESLYKKYPKKSQLAEALMDLLSIERESAYRRLRKEIIFPVHEVCKIASAWNISIDEIVGISASKILFQMYLMDYLAPSNDDMEFIRKRIQQLEQLDDYSDSQYVAVCNNLSRSLSAGFPNLYKFNVFKWAYEYCNHCNKDSNMTFSEIIIPEKLLEEVTAYYQNVKRVANTTFVLDSMLFDFFVREVQFFHSIFLITDEDKEQLKKELHALLDYFLEIASKGCFPETKNKVQIYISTLNINTNYSYFYDGEMELCRIHAFNMYDCLTYNPKMIEDFKEWMQKKKRTSFLISETDERSRVGFFMKQRQLIDTL